MKLYQISQFDEENDKKYCISEADIELFKEKLEFLAKKVIKLHINRMQEKLDAIMKELEIHGTLISRGFVYIEPIPKIRIKVPLNIFNLSVLGYEEEGTNICKSVKERTIYKIDRLREYLEYSTEKLFQLLGISIKPLDLEVIDTSSLTKETAVRGAFLVTNKMIYIAKGNPLEVYYYTWKEAKAKKRRIRSQCKDCSS